MPLADPPPYATDEPVSFYESSPAPQRRQRRLTTQDPNQRSSAYNVYDNYLGDEQASIGQDNRNSGVGALGFGLLNLDSDDDSDEDEGKSHGKTSTRSAATVAPAASSKHAALAAATGVNSARSSPMPMPTHQPLPAPHQKHQEIRQEAPKQPQHRAIVAPRPGYVAPVSALHLAQPQATVAPRGCHIDNSHNAQASSAARFMSSPSPGLISSEPHPLQPPITPITPVFARPAKTSSPASVTFSPATHTNKPIMRGNTEDPLLPGRGEKGDDFWRRFSMIAKTDGKGYKESTWLRKTQDGSTRLSRWVWVVGILLLLCIAGAIGLGVWRSRNSNGNQPPKAFGGSADEASIAPTAVSHTITNIGAATSSSLHVSPTFTVARRAALPSGLGEAHQRRRLDPSFF